jgi:hypothetical protein
MTEAEWLACDDPGPMLDFLRRTGRVRQRKMLLFVCAVLRQGLTTDSAAVWQSLDLAERWAGGEATDEEVERVHLPAQAAMAGLIRDLLSFMPGHLTGSGMAGLIRDLFGPLPFRPLPAISPSVFAYNAGLVLRLAQSAYEERALPNGHLDEQRLAVLADALEEAGCSDADLLGHLRGPGPHVRGCFAVDAVLGKE